MTPSRCSTGKSTDPLSWAAEAFGEPEHQERTKTYEFRPSLGGRGLPNQVAYPDEDLRSANVPGITPALQGFQYSRGDVDARPLKPQLVYAL